VRLPTVDFDREPLTVPIGVHLEPLDPGVQRGAGEAGGSDEHEQQPLRAGPAEGGRPVDLGRFGQRDRAAVAAPAREQAVDRAEVEQPQPLGPLDRPAEAAARARGGDVEEGLRKAGHRDPLSPGPVLGAEPRGVVHPYPCPPVAPGRNRDLDRVREAGAEPPEPRRASVARHRIPPAGHDRCEAQAVAGQAGVTDRVDAAVDPVQPPGPQRPSDGARRVPQRPQLPRRNHSVLPLGDGGQAPVRTHFFPHTGHKCVRTRFSPRGNVCSGA
jgi:hypothetical protein